MVSPGLEGGAGMGGGELAAGNGLRSTVRRVERGVWAGREAEAQIGAVNQEAHCSDALACSTEELGARGEYLVNIA